jgi:hypothetical protein
VARGMSDQLGDNRRVRLWTFTDGQRRCGQVGAGIAHGRRLAEIPS